MFFLHYLIHYQSGTTVQRVKQFASFHNLELFISRHWYYEFFEIGYTGPMRSCSADFVSVFLPDCIVEQLSERAELRHYPRHKEDFYPCD